MLAPKIDRNLVDNYSTISLEVLFIIDKGVADR
jgi:hypothetical protein